MDMNLPDIPSLISSSFGGGVVYSTKTKTEAKKSVEKILGSSFVWERFVTVLGHSLLTKIHKGFIAKSEGGSDSLGNSWKSLKQSTIAGRPIQGRDSLSLSIRGRQGRGLLTKTQDTQWKGIFASNFGRLVQFMPPPAASSKAASIAWGILKSKGAETRKETLGSRKVPILIDTGRLEKSLRPGKLSSKSYRPPSKDQIFKTTKNSLVLGTSVSYAADQHKTRRLWPKDIGPWVEEAISEAIGSVMEDVKEGVR